MSLDAGTALRNIGEFSDVTAISVSDASATSHTVSAGKGFVSFQNIGTGISWFGGSTLVPGSRGHYLVPGQIYVISEPSADFKVYFKSTTGVTTSIGIIEG